MRVTALGHAGLFVETAGGSVLCDPWFNPAFFGSWFVYPDNSGLDVSPFAAPDYLFVSHSHDDHFDAEFLRRHVSKDAVVILPEYPTSDHRRALEEVGFHEFLVTRNGRPVEIDGLTILVEALTAPTDGAIGDAGLALSDRSATIFNQNDSKPTDLSSLRELGPYDAHFVQFSGAIWYPMVYRFDETTKRDLVRRKRANQFTRAERFVREIGAPHFFPFAGPPAFLDDDLFALNDVGDHDRSIFADQVQALEYMEGRSAAQGHLVVPGTVVEICHGDVSVCHPVADDELLRPFTHKLEYLLEYQARSRPLIEAEHASWPDHEVDVLAALQEWWEPLLAVADHVADGVGAPLLVDCGDVAVVVDFPARRVVPFTGQACPYRFFVRRPLVERCIQRRESDWLNALLLSCRFEAERDGGYNEYVYNFFRSLSMERIEYTERFYGRAKEDAETFVVDGYEIQRRCPHLRADLTRFGNVDGNVLTCALHGWRFDLDSGRCLNSPDRSIRCRKVADAPS